MSWTAVQILLLIFAWATVFLWLAAFFWTRRELRELKFPAAADFSLIAISPRVSILLPARNEEQRILPYCLQSLLEQNYSNFEIIAINDRSTDRTGEILRRFENERLLVIEGMEPPAGWLGKPFALQQALTRSNGEWILTVDADVFFAPETVKNALAFAIENRLQALCLLPFVDCKTFWERIFMPVFDWFRMLKMPPTRVNNFLRTEALGIGSFFLVRRDCLEKIGNFESVRAAVAEDLLLADLIKKSGARFSVKSGADFFETRMYEGLAEIWYGFTKNFFAGAKFNFARTAFETASIVLQGVMPFFFAFACLAIWLAAKQFFFLVLFVPFALIYFLQMLVFAPLLKQWKISVFYAIFIPLALGLFVLILLNSAIKVLSGRGVNWKGRAIYQK
jgi:chlorobactene glucosyltransferase